MIKPDEVEAMLGLYELGPRTKPIAREFGCSRNTVEGRFFRHRGNAEVVRQDLERELSIGGHANAGSSQYAGRAIGPSPQSLECLHPPSGASYWNCLPVRVRDSAISIIIARPVRLIEDQRVGFGTGAKHTRRPSFSSSRVDVAPK